MPKWREGIVMVVLNFFVVIDDKDLVFVGVDVMNVFAIVVIIFAVKSTAC